MTTQTTTHVSRISSKLAETVALITPTVKMEVVSVVGGGSLGVKGVNEIVVVAMVIVSCCPGVTCSVVEGIGDMLGTVRRTSVVECRCLYVVSGDLMVVFESPRDSLSGVFVRGVWSFLVCDFNIVSS